MEKYTLLLSGDEEIPHYCNNHNISLAEKVFKCSYTHRSITPYNS